ncbi:MAG: hypothetical protein PHS44_06100 [Candidatus Dojkabacteria bacterium]|nr:hypothetical protein [Candidatus Dojkabacteria bacterium]
MSIHPSLKTDPGFDNPEIGLPAALERNQVRVMEARERLYACLKCESVNGQIVSTELIISELRTCTSFIRRALMCDIWLNAFNESDTHYEKTQKLNILADDILNREPTDASLKAIGRLREVLSEIKPTDLASAIEIHCKEMLISPALEILLKLNIEERRKAVALEAGRRIEAQGNVDAYMIGLRATVLRASGRKILPQQKRISSYGSSVVSKESPQQVLYGLDYILEAGDTSELRIVILGKTGDAAAQRRRLHTLISFDSSGRQSDHILGELANCHPQALAHIINNVLAGPDLPQELSEFRSRVQARLAHHLY